MSKSLPIQGNFWQKLGASDNLLLIITQQTGSCGRFFVYLVIGLFWDTFLLKMDQLDPYFLPVSRATKL